MRWFREEACYSRYGTHSQYMSMSKRVSGGWRIERRRRRRHRRDEDAEERGHVCSLHVAQRRPKRRVSHLVPIARARLLLFALLTIFFDIGLVVI